MTARRVVAVVATAAAAAVVAYAVRAQLLAALLPLIGWVVDALLPDGIARTTLAVVRDRGQDLVALDVALTRPLRVGGALVPSGEIIHATTLVAYVLQHVTLVYAVLAAWSFARARERAAALLLGIPAVAAAILLDIPFVLAGLIHDLLIDAGAPEAALRNLAVYYELVQRGGRAGISVAVAVAVCLAFGARRGAETSRGARGVAPSRSGEVDGRAGAAQQPPAFE
jgi:hypothetical protein